MKEESDEKGFKEPVSFYVLMYGEGIYKYELSNWRMENRV